LKGEIVMTEMDLKLNIRLMEEMGYEEGDRKRIYDQDSGCMCAFKGKDIVSPGTAPGKQTVEFDPVNNPRMMNLLFGGFINKLQEEESIPPVSSYFMKQDANGKNIATVVMEDSSQITSAPYLNETLAYTDLVLRLNGEEEVDLQEYDIDRRKAPESVVAPKKTTKKASKKNGKAI